MSIATAATTDFKPASDDAYGRLQTVGDQLRGVLRGKPEVIDSVLTAVLAAGSVLLEDVPGVGKTTLAKSLARLIELDYRRVQCTPDLLPADILGGSIYQPATGTFEFRAGPVFCNLLVADEINRASPRTQSALLEAMAERQVTIDGTRYELEEPFMVIATQNPAGFEGTYPLPESQLDRFLMRLSIDYPDAKSEVDLLLDQADEDPVDHLMPVMSAADLVTLQRRVRGVAVSRPVAQYVVDLVGRTRRDERLRIGVSPRGSKALLRAAQARAMVAGRDYCLPDDIQSVAASVLSHRVTARRSAETAGTIAGWITETIASTPVPV